MLNRVFPGKEEKKDADGELWGNVEAQAAFLGPNLWDKTLPYDADLKVLNHVCTKREHGKPAANSAEPDPSSEKVTRIERSRRSFRIVRPRASLLPCCIVRHGQLAVHSFTRVLRTLFFLSKFHFKRNVCSR